MGQKDSPKPAPCRRDGWTVERQLHFLAVLQSTKCVAAAAHSVGLSRESAYRLRNRIQDSLFAALWDSAFVVSRQRPAEGHAERLTDGRLERLLGAHYR